MRIGNVRLPFLIAAAVALLAGAISLRSQAQEEPDWNPRVAQRQQLRWLSAYITAYARDYGRPAFYLDSVVAHLDSATAVRFNSYLVDLWGDKVYYRWDEQSFELSSRAGLSPRRHSQLQDSVRLARLARGDSSGVTRPWTLAKRFDIREEYWWPVEARGRRNRLGQFTRMPGASEPILIRAEPLPRVSPPEAPRWDPPSSHAAQEPSSPAPRR